MKITLSLLALLSFSATAAEVPHLDLEMTSAEYRGILSQNKNIEDADHPAVALALRHGERLAKWLAFENARRTPSTALRLTSSGTRTGIPIDKPSIYSEKTIQTTSETLAKELPAEMIAVLNGADFPAQLPGADDADFVKMARRVDRNYQSAARFKTLLPYRSSYIRNKAKDVRSYHFFVTNGWTSARFADFATLPDAEKTIIRGHLSGMCQNTGASAASCVARVARAEAAGNLGTEFATLSANSAAIWRAFFDIPAYAVRRDVDHSNPKVMAVTFNTPSIPKFIPYLQTNIEDEFRFGDWGIKMTFGNYPNGALLKFETGVVPHVNGLGGNEIVMDSNQPIEEYESQWTIRHEYGHVIGLPDCYHEFFDSELGAFVNYQLDVTDLMCSRAGNMNERIYKELVRVYRN